MPAASEQGEKKSGGSGIRAWIFTADAAHRADHLDTQGTLMEKDPSPPGWIEPILNSYLVEPFAPWLLQLTHYYLVLET